MHRRRADHDRRRVHQRHRQLADIGRRQLKLFDNHAALRQRGGQIIDHQFGAAVHRDVGNHHDIRKPVRHPLLIRRKDALHMVIDRAVAGRDQVERQRPDFFEIALHAAAERHHDLGIVTLGRRDHRRVFACVQARRGDVRAQEVARKQDLFFRQVRDHRLGPMDPRRVEKLQGLAAQRERLAVRDRPDARFVKPEVVDQQRLGFRRADHDSLGIHRQYGGDGACMILLGMLRHQVIDARHLGQLPLQGLEQGRIDRVDQRRFFVAFDEIRVVAGAVGQRNQGIKQPPVPIDSPHPKNIAPDLPRFHRQPPLIIEHALTLHQSAITRKAWVHGSQHGALSARTFASTANV